MKLKIEKTGDKVKIEVATDAAKKPIVVELTALQLNYLIGTLQVAAKSQAFGLELDL